MAYVLSDRSESRLTGVHPALVAVVRDAIRLTRQDFAVIEGLRDIERQKRLVVEGKSRTLNSRHLTGHAVDLMAWTAGGADWNAASYYEIALAMAKAAGAMRVPIRWGGCWAEITYAENLEDLHNLVGVYSATQRARGRGIFFDGPHFELVRSAYP